MTLSTDDKQLTSSSIGISLFVLLSLHIRGRWKSLLNTLYLDCQKLTCVSLPTNKNWYFQLIKVQHSFCRVKICTWECENGNISYYAVKSQIVLFSSPWSEDRSRKKPQNLRERLSVYAHDCIYFNMRLPCHPANLSILCDSEMQSNFF